MFRVILGLLLIAALCIAPFVLWIYLITDDQEYQRRVKAREAGVRIVARINNCPDELEAE